MIIQKHQIIKKNKLAFKSLQEIYNFKKIDKNIWRSGQPTKSQIFDLKDNNVTHILNFRTLYEPKLDFIEVDEVKKAGMISLSMPLTSIKGPSIDNIKTYFKLTDKIREKDLCLLQHCKEGKDRTGFMSGLYMVRYKIATIDECVEEMISMGHHKERFPNLIPMFKEMAKKFS